MFFKRLQRLLGLRTLVPVDPRSFNDPLALQVSWAPASPGGTSFRTHSFVEVPPQQVRFRATLQAYAFGGLFAGLGGLFTFFSGRFPQRHTDPAVTHWFVLLLGPLFLALGLYMLYSFCRPIVFDRSSGYFWKGWPPKDTLSGLGSPKNALPLAQIHALQLLAERCRSRRGSFFSFELNLVLNDGRRIPVVDHGNLQAILDDSAALGRFLGKPVWHGIPADNP
jgi:hypothetical protein